MLTIARAHSMCRRTWSISDGCDKSQNRRDAAARLTSHMALLLRLLPGGPARAMSSCTRSCSEHIQWQRAWVFSRTCSVLPQTTFTLVPTYRLSLMSPALACLCSKVNWHLRLFFSLLAPFQTPRVTFPSLHCYFHLW